MSWQVVPDAVVEIRNRWQQAPRTLGPWSRHPRSIDLLRHARDDIATLLAHLDLTRRDPVAELCHELAQLGARDVEIIVKRPLRGERGVYEVRWSVIDVAASVVRSYVAQGWSPSVALRNAIRHQRRHHSPDSDRLRDRAWAE